MQEILVIEDDLILSKSICELLEEEGFVTKRAKSVAEARHQKSDLIILDWRLPDGRGVDLLKDMRAAQDLTPVIMLTSKNDLEDKILGLEFGANDYMTKPFEPKELLARVNVQFRGSTPLDRDKIIIGDISISKNERRVSLKNKSIDLTKLEFDLLFLFSENPSKVFSRDELLNRVWGFESFPTTRTVDVHIKQLRQKLGEQYFKTVHGIGYQFNFS